MAMIPGANSKPTTKKELIPADMYIARCYSIIDLGTQEVLDMTSKEIVLKHQVYIGWELDCYMQEPGDNQGKPFVKGKTYKFSMHEKASLRKDIEAVRGKMTDDEARVFDLETLLNTYATFTVAHAPDKNDPEIIWANVSTMSPYNAKIGKKFEAINANIFFDMSEQDTGKLIASYQSIPKNYKWVRELIQKSAEWDTLRMFLEGTEIKPNF